MKAGRLRIFASVTLPGARSGLVSAAVVVFTRVVTDFGIPNVISGQIPVLATDVYKQVAGLQNFNMGAVPGLVLGLAFILFFNHLLNPLGFLYGTLWILVLNSQVHFYTMAHLAGGDRPAGHPADPGLAPALNRTNPGFGC